MFRLTRSISVLVLAALLAGPALSAPTSLQRRIYQSFMDGDFARAATLIETQLEHDPRDPVMLYNAACAYCHLQQPDRAASYLRRAVEAGLDDLSATTRSTEP
jgi:Tfp pilus assembly protein PilF